MYNNILDYIKTLEKEGELLRINTEVSTMLEIAEITDRESKSSGGGKAILFEKNETKFPVLTNMMGSRRRMELTLGVKSLEEPAERIYELFGKVTSEKSSFIDKIKMLSVLGEASRWMPRKLSTRGSCQEIVMDSVDLSCLPILKCAPLDGGRFVTLPLVNTISAETGIPNLGMYRMQVFDNTTTGMHWHRHKTGERHYQEYKARGERMPVTVCLGGDPVYTYSATAPLPEGISEYLLAGFLRRKPVELVKSITNDIYIPADSDFVIEGYVDPTEEKVVEGPFGDHTGFYSLEDMYPLFHVTAITHRRNAVYSATLVGVPPMEDAYIAEATERLFLAPIRLVAQPDIVNMFMPWQGVAHNIVLMDIEKRYPYQGFKVAQSMWGAGQMMFNKFSVITSGLNHQLSNIDTLKTVIKNIEPERDFLISRGPLDVLDHTSNATGFGGKLAIDATDKTAEGYTKQNEINICNIKGIKELETINTKLYETGWATLFAHIELDIDYKNASTKFVDNNSSAPLKFMFLFDPVVDLNDISTAIWLIGSNVEPTRDLLIYKGVAIFDCRAKRGGVNGFTRRWPNVVAMDRTTIDLVDKKWNSYDIGDFKPSPSLNYQKLLLSLGVDA